MKQQHIERGAMTSGDVLALLSGERHYGASELTTTHMFEQPVSKGFEPIAEELRAKLNLPKLEGNARRTLIYAAYGHDVLLLHEYLDGFMRFIQSAIRASTNEAGRTRWQSEWRFVEESMPALAHTPLVDFSAEVAAMPEQELVRHLKTEIDIAVTSMFRVVCFWLDALVSHEFVGLLKITSADAGRYHYFRPLRTEIVLEKGDGQFHQVAYDPSQPFGKRTTYEQKSGSLVEVHHDLERHDHDIVNMQTHTVEEYPEKMPWRVARFLEETPEFIRRHLRVVSGVIIKETVLKRTVATELADTRHTSTWLASPAIVLGDAYVPLGWSEKDMQPGNTTYFKGQRTYVPPSKILKALQALKKRAIRTLATLTFTALVLWIGWETFSYVKDIDQGTEIYPVYGAQHVGEPQEVTFTRTFDFLPKSEVIKETIIRLPVGTTVTFPRGEHFDLTSISSKGGRFEISLNPMSPPKEQRKAVFQAPEASWEGYFGSVNLEPELGLPITLHLLNVYGSGISMYGSYRIEFTYEYND